MGEKKDTIVIIGAGPAGLTAAYELASKSNYHIVVLEADKQVGGISKTVDYKGNKIDIGGHRFFSKSDWVLDWWQQFLPISSTDQVLETTYQNQQKAFKISKLAEAGEPHMMVRSRKSRIYHNRRLFDYPLKINLDTLSKIGIWKSLMILKSIFYSRMFPIGEERNLEDFFINRFGKKLYSTFFKDYTQKVWGKSCDEISAEWGKQRVQGLSLRKIFKHYFTTLFFPQRQTFGNKETEQTLTEYFLYPQEGPGQLWDRVAAECKKYNVEIRLNHRVTAMKVEDEQVSEIEVLDGSNLEAYTISCHHIISTMPVRHLIRSLGSIVPQRILDTASSLEYRDFLIVGILLEDLKLKDKQGKSITDNWLYIQDGDVKVGRVQLFHNWSPYMVADSNNCWIGAEYFCQKGDDLWNKSKEELIKFASEELGHLGLIDPSKVLDGTVVRMPKAYPSYVGSYQEFDQVKDYLDTFDNLSLIGRNGTHKYNNQDHSMLTAREAVNGILSDQTSKKNIWNVNTEQAYHEEKA